MSLMPAANNGNFAHPKTIRQSKTRTDNPPVSDMKRSSQYLQFIVSCAMMVLASLMGTTGCLSVNPQSHLLTYEIRVPASNPLASDTKVDVVTSDNASGARIFNCNAATNFGSIIYEGSTLIFRNKNRRLIVAPPSGSAQVFVINHPALPRPAPWSAWLKPVYMDSSSMPWWNAMNEQGRECRTTNIPANCVQMRFKVDNWRGLD